MNFIYSGSVCSDLDLVKNFLDEIMNKLNRIIDNKDTIFDVKLILNELVINGVFHGNECEDTKCVNLSLQICNGKIIIDVEDEGEGIDYDFGNYDALDLKSSGRGLVLVKGLSDELIVKENHITAIKSI